MESNNKKRANAVKFKIKCRITGKSSIDSYGVLNLQSIFNE